MSTDVIYARVPAELKEAAEQHAADRGYTLTAAVSELLGLGLEALHNARSIQALQQRIATLEHDLEDARVARQQEELRRQVAEQQAEMLRSVAGNWSQRAQQRIGQCPDCGAQVTGMDLLVAGTCPACKHAVNSMLMPDEPKTNRVDWSELLPILVAGGVVLGAVVAARGKS